MHASMYKLANDWINAQLNTNYCIFQFSISKTSKTKFCTGKTMQFQTLDKRDSLNPQITGRILTWR